MSVPMTLDEALEELHATRNTVSRQRRELSDTSYMMTALVQMLGPKGRQVWDTWMSQGLKRIHTSWGPGAAELSGEEIAQQHLDFKEAAKTAVPVENIDTHINKIDVREWVKEIVREHS